MGRFDLAQRFAGNRAADLAADDRVRRAYLEG